jgi:hypothetical protein
MPVARQQFGRTAGDPPGCASYQDHMAARRWRAEHGYRGKRGNRHGIAGRSSNPGSGVRAWLCRIRGAEPPKDGKIEHMGPQDNVIVRGENTEDAEERSAIRSIHEAAFGRPDEAGLVDRLRVEGVVLVSLV